MKRIIQKSKSKLRQVRHHRVRSRVKGTKVLPRLSVFRGLKSMVAQLIDDQAGVTLCFAKSSEISKVVAPEGKKGKVASAYAVGKLIAEKAAGKGITTVVFDRGGYRYHGRVAALAEGAREGGLKF